jgi:Glyoxalase/Bleomycin resistance protein/Dioxygenase superfamily
MKPACPVLAALFVFLCTPAFAQLNDCYKTVDHLIWVVRDIERVAGKWEGTGITRVGKVASIDLKGTRFGGRESGGRIRCAAGNLAGAKVAWIQPVSGDNAYSAFAGRRGEGVLALVHRLDSSQALDQEVARLQSLGVGVLQEGPFPDAGSGSRLVLLDTAAEGKYVLGLSCGSQSPGEKATATGHALSQYAFVVRDMRPVSAYWKKLGWPVMSYTHGQLIDLQYRGRPGRFDQELGWQRQGKIVYEWIVALKGPTVYEDFLKVHGEGFHHLAFDVPDMDKAIAKWKGAGYENVQSGAWGDAGKPGSGRFAYIDTGSIGGVVVELLWDFGR